MSGLLGKVLTDNTIQTVAAVPNNVPYSYVNINVANGTGQAAELTVWFGTGTEPVAVDLIEPAAQLSIKGSYNREAHLLNAGEKIFVKGTTGLAVRVETVDGAPLQQ